jgi:hypothetical protein
MAERMDLVTPRAGRDGKTWWTKIGVAWSMEKGGWRLNFEALPLPSKNRDGDWETTVIMRPPFEKDGERPARQVSSDNRSSVIGPATLDDETPF